MPRPGVDEDGNGLDSGPAQNRAQQHGLVLAVAETAAVYDGGRCRFVGGRPHLQAEVADVVLDQAKGLADDLTRIEGPQAIRPLAQLRRQRIGGERIQGKRPGYDFPPISELAPLNPGIGIVP